METGVWATPGVVCKVCGKKTKWCVGVEVENMGSATEGSGMLGETDDLCGGGWPGPWMDRADVSLGAK